MAAPDRFIAWCKQEQASIEQQLELLQSGKVRTGEDIGAGWIDTTEQSIERAQARLSELNELLTEAGTATVVNLARSNQGKKKERWLSQGSEWRSPSRYPQLLHTHSDAELLPTTNVDNQIRNSRNRRVRSKRAPGLKTGGSRFL